MLFQSFFYVCVFTFHDVHQGAHVALLNDTAVFSILDRVHAVHDLLDLRQLQVFHEVIVQDGLLDQILGPGNKVKPNEMVPIQTHTFLHCSCPYPKTWWARMRERNWEKDQTFWKPGLKPCLFSVIQWKMFMPWPAQDTHAPYFLLINVSQSFQNIYLCFKGIKAKPFHPLRVNKSQNRSLMEAQCCHSWVLFEVSLQTAASLGHSTIRTVFVVMTIQKGGKCHCRGNRQGLVNSKSPLLTFSTQNRGKTEATMQKAKLWWIIIFIKETLDARPLPLAEIYFFSMKSGDSDGWGRNNEA